MHVLRSATGLLVFAGLTGLLLFLFDGYPAAQYFLLAHIAAGLLPIPYFGRFFVHIGYERDSRRLIRLLLGKAALPLAFLATASGLGVAWQAAVGPRISAWLHYTHLVTGLVLTGLLILHLIPLLDRLREADRKAPIAEVPGGRGYAYVLPGATLLALCAVAIAAWPPEGYTARDVMSRTGVRPALAATKLAEPESCGRSRCHRDIYQEWAPSAHRYAASDVLFMRARDAQASVRFAADTHECDACHQPLSSLAGQRIARTAAHDDGFEQGISCAVCHSIHRVILGGGTRHVLRAPRACLFQNQPSRVKVFLNEFLIRALPTSHKEDYSLASQGSEVCGSCHLHSTSNDPRAHGDPSGVGLRLQYSDWEAGKWHRAKDSSENRRCQDCHMRPTDGTREPSPLQGGKHFNHRFAAANALSPVLLKLAGAEAQAAAVHEWFGQGAVPVRIIAPSRVAAGETFAFQTALSNDKVGHSFPSGPLALVETWVEVIATDAGGKRLFESGTLDAAQRVSGGQRIQGVLLPGESGAAAWRFRVPVAARSPLTLSATLRYRRVSPDAAARLLPNWPLRAPIANLSSVSTRIVIERPGLRTSN